MGEPIVSKVNKTIMKYIQANYAPYNTSRTQGLIGHRTIHTLTGQRMTDGTPE
jgi:hypothetical protein